jgi:RecA-family ATPase
MTRLTSIVVTVLALLVAGTGCKQPTKQDPIRATDDTSFQTWVDEHQRVLTPAENKELTEARQLIRFRVMQAHPGMPAADFANAVYADINGKTVRDVLMTGCVLQIDRVRVELENYKPLVAKLKEYQQMRLNDEQKRDAEAKLANLDRLMREHREELDRLNQHLEELKNSAATKS